MQTRLCTTATGIRTLLFDMVNTGSSHVFHSFIAVRPRVRGELVSVLSFRPTYSAYRWSREL
jgi:hypothetical protein